MTTMVMMTDPLELEPEEIGKDKIIAKPIIKSKMSSDTKQSSPNGSKDRKKGVNWGDAPGEPGYKWNTDEAEAHIKEMKRLDRKMAKYEEDKKKLRELIKQEDEKCESYIERFEDRYQRAVDEMKEFEHQAQAKEKEIVSTTMTRDQLQTKLLANRDRVVLLRKEGKKLQKDKRITEKQLDKLKYNNIKLEESSAVLLNSFSDLFGSKAFDESATDFLQEDWEGSKDEHEELTDQVNHMQEMYMVQAQQRLGIQKGLAEILTLIQTKCKDAELANACTQVAIECEDQTNAFMAELEAEYANGEE